MRLIISFARYIILLGVTAVLTGSFLAYAFRPIYGALFPEVSGGFGDLDYAGVALFFVALQFFIPLFFFVLGDKNRFWAFGVALLTLGLLDYRIDSSRILTLLFVVLLGAGLGWLTRLIAANTLGKMQSLQPLKKYF